MEGRMYYFYRRSGLSNKGVAYLDVLRNLIKYLEQDQYPVMHPTHPDEFTSELKALTRKAKQLKKGTPKHKEILDEIKAIKAARKQAQSESDRITARTPPSEYPLTRCVKSPWIQAVEINSEQLPSPAQG